MLWTRFLTHVEQSPDYEAVVTSSRRWTYGELAAEAEVLATRLLQEGFRLGDSLAIYIPNGFDFIMTFLALARSGFVAVPLNVNYQAGELRGYLQHSGVRAVITEEKRRTHLEPILGCLESPPRLVVLEELSALYEFPPPEEPHACVASDSPALRHYSTGSTGQPKPVVRTQGHLMAEAEYFARAIKMTPDDRILIVVPLFHSYGLGNGLVPALMNGATMIVLEAFNPREVLVTLQQEGVTLYLGVPFMFKLLTETKLNGRCDLSKLRLVVSAGAALNPEVSDAFLKRFGLPVRQLYGSTETGSVTINLDSDVQGTIGSVGRAMPPVEVAIFDESGDRLPAGEEGEIGLRGPTMTSGYEGLPEATSDSFRNGFFYPGDIGWLDKEGRLYITGRKTFFINVGGNKVDPAEVERVVATHPKVKEVVVLGVKAPYGGEMVKAVVVASEPCQPSEIVEVCKGWLAEYKVPKLVEFRDEIPRSPLGKVLRKYLV